MNARLHHALITSTSKIWLRNGKKYTLYYHFKVKDHNYVANNKQIRRLFSSNSEELSALPNNICWMRCLDSWDEGRGDHSGHCACAFNETQHFAFLFFWTRPVRDPFRGSTPSGSNVRPDFGIWLFFFYKKKMALPNQCVSQKVKSSSPSASSSLPATLQSPPENIGRETSHTQLPLLCRVVCQPSLIVRAIWSSTVAPP